MLKIKKLALKTFTSVIPLNKRLYKKYGRMFDIMIFYQLKQYVYNGMSYYTQYYVGILACTDLIMPLHIKQWHMKSVT